jgi:NitT/TauT family transport system substrate-binding protein
MHSTQNRRGFLAGTAMAGAAGLLGLGPRLALAASSGEPPPETPTLRLSRWAGICLAPQYVAEDLLRAEGFSDVRYLDVGPVTSKPLADGVTDFSLEFSPDLLVMAENHRPVTVLAGVHVGCLELHAHGDIRTITDLEGRTVGLPGLDGGEHLFMMSIAAYVGLDPRTITFVGPTEDASPRDLFIDGRIDAYFSGPPEVQDLRARGIGHVILKTAVDDPWSQYYCCMLTANAAFVEANPIATKRVVRAIMKATDLCYEQPQWVAQRLVDEGFADRYDYALEALNEVRYGLWREYDPENTVRFYALRLHEVGMLQSTPNDLIARLTDWRYLDEVKRELKV